MPHRRENIVQQASNAGFAKTACNSNRGQVLGRLAGQCLADFGISLSTIFNKKDRTIGHDPSFGHYRRGTVCNRRINLRVPVRIFIDQRYKEVAR